MSNEEPTDKKSFPTPKEWQAEKLSQARRQIFRAGFTAGMAYRGCPKYSHTDPMAMFSAFKVCDEMFDLMEADKTVAHNGKDQIQSIARVLGLSEDKPKK